jgi:hypothetical protein
MFFSLSSASAAVRLQGQWDGHDPLVTLDADQVTPGQALNLLANAAGWSIVAPDLGNRSLSLGVRDQPASSVLAMILSDTDYVARQDNDRVFITTEAVPPQEESHDSRQDRSAFGSDIRIEQGESVRNVVATGGNIDIFGHVQKNVNAFGGDVFVHENASIGGDVQVVGGTVHLADRSRIDGNVDVIGGSLERDASAVVRGSISDNGTTIDATSLETKEHQASVFEPTSWMSQLVSDTQHAISRTVLLFLFGVVFWALLSPQMQALEVEVAARPMRSLALGLVGLLTATLAAIVLIVTVVGIPFAAVGVITTIVVAYVGACAVLSTVGQALLRHKTQNRYIHLAVGCALFLLLTAIPYMGFFVWSGVLLIGLGAVVATRGMGLVPRKERYPDQGPYRTAPC